MRGSIFLLLGDFHSAIDSFEKTLALFNAEKQRELEKHYAEDSEEFQDEWSEIEIKFNVSLCYLGLRVFVYIFRTTNVLFSNCKSSASAARRARIGQPTFT